MRAAQVGVVSVVWGVASLGVGQEWRGEDEDEGGAGGCLLRASCWHCSFIEALTSTFSLKREVVPQGSRLQRRAQHACRAAPCRALLQVPMPARRGACGGSRLAACCGERLSK